MHSLKFIGCETTEKFKKFIGNSNGLFVIESNDRLKGGYVEWGKGYKLRHLSYKSIILFSLYILFSSNNYLALGDFLEAYQKTEKVLFY